MPWKVTQVSQQREQFVQQALSQQGCFSALCLEHGISRKTGYKWLKRAKQQGHGSLADRPRSHRQDPDAYWQSVFTKIVCLHQAHPKWGPKKIHHLVNSTLERPASLSTVKRFFMGAGWTQRRRHRSQSQIRLNDGRVGTAANEVWSIDFKGWWRTLDDARFEPLTVRDEYSRYILLAQCLKAGGTQGVQGALQRLFELYGKPTAIRSDNGSPFACTAALLGLSKLAVWLLAQGIELLRSRPAKPQDNGAHERMHGDISQDVQAVRCPDVVTQQAALDAWKEQYNKVRPHEALGMATPASVYRKSTQRFELVEQLEYASMPSRKVDACGRIRLWSQYVFLSTALRGWQVGVERLGPDNYAVHFAGIQLGSVERRSLKLIVNEALSAKRVNAQKLAQSPSCDEQYAHSQKGSGGPAARQTLRRENQTEISPSKLNNH